MFILFDFMIILLVAYYSTLVKFLVSEVWSKNLIGSISTDEG